MEPETARSGPRIFRWKWSTPCPTATPASGASPPSRRLRRRGARRRRWPPSTATSADSLPRKSSRDLRKAGHGGIFASSDRTERFPRGSVELAQLPFERLEQPSASVPERRVVQPHVAADVQALHVAPRHVADDPVEQRRAAELDGIDPGHVPE